MIRILQRVQAVLYTGLLGLGLVSNGQGQSPMITEIMASNQRTLQDGYGEYSDWIELHNPHETAINLHGYLLRDSDTDWPCPNVTLEADEYLVIYASGAGEPDPNGTLHTSFGLAKSGEGVSLVTSLGNVVSEFDEVPPQRSDVSYGIDIAGELAFFTSPTPGEPNQSGVKGFVRDTKFSVKRGHFEEAFELEINTETEDAIIVYTTDGRDPRRGTVFNPVKTYGGPITVDKTTTIRAFAKKSGYLSTNIDTQTYIFTKDVIRQGKAPVGFPESWGEYTGTNGSVRGKPVPADYEMNPSMVDDDPKAMEAALKSLPSLSIVMNPGDLFGKDGILPNPFGGVNGSGVHTMDPFVKDRQTSVEWIDPNGGPEMQIDCGIRLSGGWSRHYIASPKKSFSLLFKEAFGPSKLNFPLFGETVVQEFDRMILKAIFSNAWPDAARPPDYLRDHFTRQTRLDMGEPASDGSWVHLYLNGLYWGLYNPTERPDASYAASHFGGSKEEYDAIKHAGLRGPGQATNDQFEVIDGNDEKWNAVLELTRDGLKDSANYEAFKELVDVKNLADYAILNIYASNADWPHKNWYANSKRQGGAGFRFYSWDSEYAWHDLNADRTNVANRNTPAELFSKVRQNKDFQLLFADRIQKHLFGDGALTEEANVERFTRMAARIESGILAEAARWGDHGGTRQGRTNYTKDHWESARDGIINNFLKKRHDKALEQFVDVDLYPALQGVSFGRYSGQWEVGTSITMRSPDAKSLLKPSGADIYYTLDGSDPRNSDNTLSDSAFLYKSPLKLTESGAVRARLFQKNLFTGGTWSASTESTYIVGTIAADASNLMVSKIHYRPAAPSQEDITAGYDSRSDFEYIELLNRSEQTIHLAGVHFAKGIDYRFAEGQELAAGGRLLLVRNTQAFQSRFASGLPIAGTYGGKLNDGGESLALLAADGSVIAEIAYDDQAPWPEEADGTGAALVMRSTSEWPVPNDPSQWTTAGGGGRPGGVPVIDGGNEGPSALSVWLTARGIDNASNLDLLTFALGWDLNENGKSHLAVQSMDDSLELEIVYCHRSESGNVRYTVEVSQDLTLWERLEIQSSVSDVVENGLKRVTIPGVSRDRGQYFRLAVDVLP